MLIAIVAGIVANADVASADCPRGSRAAGRGKCVPVVIPENGQLDILGSGWTCKRGYRATRGKCVPVVIPENGQLDILGNGWTCKRGYRPLRGTCVPVVVPENGEIDILGSGWTCKRGFRNAAGKCVAVIVPENAELDVLGHGWTCSAGFKKRAQGCVAMTAAERAAAEARLARAVAHARRVSSSSCTIDGEEADGDRAEVVARRSGCSDYFLADGPSGFYLLQWYGGYDPSAGDIVIGKINRYGFQDVCYPGHGEGRVYVDDYLLGRSRAMEEYDEKCN